MSTTTRILHLVLYSQCIFFDKMYLVTREFYKKFTNVRTIYYLYSETHKDYCLKDDILYIPGEESLIPGVLEKTLKAFTYFKDYQYDFVVRSNISTIVQFNLLIPKIIEEKVEYGGCLINECNGLNLTYGIVDDTYHKIKYVSGTCIVFSKTIVLNIIENAEKLDRKVVDDVSFGVYLNSFVSPKNLQGFMIVKNANTIKSKGLKHYLCYRNRHPNRARDIANMKIITSIL